MAAQDARQPGHPPQHDLRTGARAAEGMGEQRPHAASVLRRHSCCWTLLLLLPLLLQPPPFLLLPPVIPLLLLLLLLECRACTSMAGRYADLLMHTCVLVHASAWVCKSISKCRACARGCVHVSGWVLMLLLGAALLAMSRKGSSTQPHSHA